MHLPSPPHTSAMRTGKMHIHQIRHVCRLRVSDIDLPNLARIPAPCAQRTRAHLFCPPRPLTVRRSHAIICSSRHARHLRRYDMLKVFASGKSHMALLVRSMGRSPQPASPGASPCSDKRWAWGPNTPSGIEQGTWARVLRQGVSSVGPAMP